MKRIGDLLSLPSDLAPEWRVIDAEELRARIRHCARLFAAWPNARPASIDATLLEYLNATRGVSLAELPALITSVIAAGGEFIPPAGALFERVVKAGITALDQGYNAHISGEQRAIEQQQRVLHHERSAARSVEPILLEEVSRVLALAGGDRAAVLESGRTMVPARRPA